MTILEKNQMSELSSEVTLWFEASLSKLRLNTLSQ